MYAAVFLAALLRYKYNAELLGLPQTRAEAAGRASSGEASGPHIVHPIHDGITPKRLLLPHSDTEILSYTDDDISSIRDGYTAWVVCDATTTRERHMASKGSAVPAFRKAYERRMHSPSQNTVSTPVCQAV